MSTDPSDRRLVDALQHEGRHVRLSDRLGEEGRNDLVRAVAEATDAPATTVQRRLRAMESEGVIEGFEPRVDYAALGFEHTAVFRLAVAPDALDDVCERLRSTRGMTDVYQITAPDDVIAIGRFESPAAVDALLKRLSTDADVETVRTNVVVDTLRDHEPLDLAVED